MLPYLNAVLARASYSHGTHALTLKRGHRLITLYPQVAIIVKADDEDDALAVLAWLSDLVEPPAPGGPISPTMSGAAPWAFRTSTACCRAATARPAASPPAWPSPVALLGRAGDAGPVPALDREHAERLGELVPAV